MALLKPNAEFKMNGVTVKEKIIPDRTRWKDAVKAKKAGFSANSLYKKQTKLNKGTGAPLFVTIHNTDDLYRVEDDGEQYTRATYNENMGSVRVHFYVDDLCAWQNMKAGTGMCVNDPLGSAEVTWHAGDGSVSDGGNMTSLSIEVIMNDNAQHDAKAYDNSARVAAWLLHHHKLTIDRLVTHTYWVNKSAGIRFNDVDEQCCNPVRGQKWCPVYIFKSSNKATAMKNWKAYKALVKKYLDSMNKNTAPESSTVVSHKYKIGDEVVISSGYKASTDTIDKAIIYGANTKSGTITRIVEARNPYLVSAANGKPICWVNDGDIRGYATPSTKKLTEGCRVKVNGNLYRSSYGGTPSRVIRGEYTVTRIIKNRQAGILLNGTLGWVSPESCTVV